MAYIIMAYVVMSYIVMAYIVMAHMVMSYVVMADRTGQEYSIQIKNYGCSASSVKYGSRSAAHLWK